MALLSLILVRLRHISWKEICPDEMRIICVNKRNWAPSDTNQVLACRSILVNFYNFRAKRFSP